MQVARAIVWGIGLASFLGLVGVARRTGGQWAWVRASLATVASAALIFILSGRPVALLLFSLNVLLVLGTWWSGRRQLWWAWIGLLVALLVISKLPVVRGLGRETMVGPVGLGLAAWPGFSYLAFRLIHVTADAHAGRLGDVSLPETLVYALHPASLVAGPIDRVRPSAQAQREGGLLSEDVHQGVWRVLVGLFTKYVIANPLYAFIAQHDMAHNPEQPIGIAWLWLLAYSVYLLADFAAYSDIAIGMGRVAGLRLPENFDRPYFSPSLAVFWQRWHMSLSSWLRDYIFFPLARSLQKRSQGRYKGAIQLVSHLATMIACGLWHGLDSGFLAWGVWHGLGLFITGQITARRPRTRPEASGLSRVVGIITTILFVMLGWVFFAADFPTALRIFGRLFGVM